MDPHLLVPTQRVGSLSDGTSLRVRPLRSDDFDVVEAVFGALSPDSRHARFFATVDLSPSLLDLLVEDVDGVDHVALVLSVATRAGWEDVALARYVRDSDSPSRAEVAFSVVDAHQGRGCGGVLLDALAEHARSSGVGTFTASVLPENSASRRLLERLGSCRASWEDGVVQVEVDLLSVPVPA